MSPTRTERIQAAARTLEKQGYDAESVATLREVAELVRPDTKEVAPDAKALYVFTKPDPIGRVYSRVVISMERIGRIETRKVWADPYNTEFHTSLFDKFGNFLLTIGSDQKWWIRPIA